MSYILDALNKAERERKRGQIPSLENPDIATAPHTQRNPWLWVAAFAVIFNAVLAGLLMYSSSQTNRGIEPTAVATTTPVTPAPDTTPTPTPADLPIHRAIAPVNAPAIPLMTDQELQAQARELAIETPETPPVPATSVNKKAATPVKKPVAPVADNTPLEMIPLLSEKPLSLQQAIPPFRVDVHVYATEPANRFVMINMKRYGEGDEVASQLLLERITKEGMVLLFRGERFRFLMKS